MNTARVNYAMIREILNRLLKEAVRLELRDILDSWDVKGFHDQNALNNRIIHYSRELQGCIERQGALERGWHCDDF
jgi:hypothetical protein